MYEIRKVETDMELLEKVLSKDNLNKAYKQVYKNKGASGVDGVTVDELFAYIREHQQLHLLLYSCKLVCMLYSSCLWKVLFLKVPYLFPPF